MPCNSLRPLREYDVLDSPFHHHLPSPTPTCLGGLPHPIRAFDTSRVTMTIAHRPWTLRKADCNSKVLVPRRTRSLLDVQPKASRRLFVAALDTGDREVATSQEPPFRPRSEFVRGKKVRSGARGPGYVHGSPLDSHDRSSALTFRKLDVSEMKLPVVIRAYDQEIVGLIWPAFVYRDHMVALGV